MKTISRFALFLSIVIVPSVLAMDEDGWASTYESLSAFDKSNVFYGNRPGYVKPIITNLSTILNSNWVSSAGVPQEFTFEAGLPFAIVPITDDDRKYGDGHPTIFGDNDKNNDLKLATDICSPEAIDQFGACPVVNGNENLHGLGVFTYPYLQLAASYYHARLVLRGMFLPSISELRKFNLLGFGLQYSFVPNHKGSRDIVIPPSDEEESVETVQTLVMTSRYHTINAIVDYKVGTFGPLSMFIGGGAGAQCRHASYSHSLYDGYFWSTDICLYAGLELFDHLRLTLGHNHDLHAQISALPTGAPFYYINIGWAF